MPQVAVKKDSQAIINETYSGIGLESSIQGWYYLKDYTHGIKEYKTLIQPTAIDEQWVGMCYFMLNQSQKAIAHVQVAIFQGNHLAHISLAHIYLFSGHTELVLAELEKLEFDDLPPYHLASFLDQSLAVL